MGEAYIYNYAESWQSQTWRAASVEESGSSYSRCEGVRLHVLQVWSSKTRRAPDVE